MEYMQKMKLFFDILRRLYIWTRLYAYIELIPFYTNMIDLQCVDKKLKNISEIYLQKKLLASFGMKCIIKCFKDNVKNILSKLKQAESIINCIGISIKQKNGLLSLKHFTLKRHFFNTFRTYAVYYSAMHHNSPETDCGSSSDEEQENNSSSSSQFTASQRSLEDDKTIDTDEVNVDKTTTEANAETSEADTKRIMSYHQKSYQEEISSTVQKFFHNFTETNKDYELPTKSKDNESLQLPDLTEFFQNNLKRKLEDELTSDARKHPTFKLPDINLYEKSTRTQASDCITRTALEEIPLGPSTNTKTFLPRVRETFDNSIIEKRVSEIRNEVIYLLKLSTNDDHNLLNIILFRLEKFQPRLKEVMQTDFVLDFLKTVAHSLEMLSFMFSKMHESYDTNEFKTITFNVFHSRDKITTIAEDANDLNDDPNVTFSRILREIVEVLTCITQIASPYFKETVSRLSGENIPSSESSDANEETEDSDLGFEHRAILLPKIYECARNPEEMKDSHSSLEPVSSDLSSASTSKEESCKTTTKEQDINPNVDPTKVKKDHRFQKRFYRQMRELRELAEKKDDVNASKSKEIEVRPSSSSASDTSASSLSPVCLKSDILEVAGTSRSLKRKYPESDIQADQTEPDSPETDDENQIQQTDKDNE